MNQLMQNKVSTMTMSSRVISDLVQSRHGDVCRSIDRLIQSGVINGYAPSPYTHEQNGQTYYEYFLCKRDTYIVVAQLSPQFTAALVDRWQELELQQKPKLPQTYAEALLEAGRLALENEKQAEQLRIAAPKVEFVEKYIDSSSGSLGFRKVAKLLNVKEPALRAFLAKEKIMYRLGSEWVPYQNHIEAGRFEVKAGLAEHEERSHAFTQSKFTAKGVEWIAGEYAKQKINEQLESMKCQKEQ